MTAASPIDAVAGELTFEAATTRRILQNVPTSRLDFRPHDKSSTLGGLALHVAQLPSWGAMVLTRTELDLAQVPAAGECTSVDAVLAAFDGSVEAFRAALTGYDPARLGDVWTLRFGTHVILALPRSAVLRSLVFNHLIHHRGQLTVYLRLVGAAVPSSYGPTADEPPSF